MAVGATAKGKAVPARGVPAKTLEEVAGGQAGEEAPQGESESTYSYYSESQSNKPMPRRASGRPPRRSPGPPVASGRKRDRSRTPGMSPRVGGSSGPGARPRASHARVRPPRKGAAPAEAAALSSSRSYAPPTREPGTLVTADPPQGSPHAAAAVAPRTAASESAPGGRRDPVPDDADRVPRDGRSRSNRRCRNRGRDREGRWPGRTQPCWVGGDNEEDAVQARWGQSRPYRPQEARRQKEEGLQDSGKAKGSYQTLGYQAGASMPRWQDQSWPRDRPHGSGKSKSQSKGGGRRGKGSKVRLRQQARNAQPRTEKQREYKGRGKDRTAQRLTTAIQNIEERRGGGGSCDLSTAAHEGAGGSGSGPAKQPRRPGPAGLPDGSNEPPGTAEKDALSPGRGTRGFPGQDKSLVHRFPSFCGLLAPGRNERDPRRPTTGKRGRRCHMWQEKMGVLALWGPGEAGRRRRVPAGTPPAPLAGSATGDHVTQGAAAPTSLQAKPGEATGGGIGCTEPPYKAARGGPNAKGVGTQGPQTEAKRTSAQRRMGEPCLPGWGSVFRVVHASTTISLRVLRSEKPRTPGPP